MFANKTRRKVIMLASQAKGAANPLVWQIPKTGLLAGIYLAITGTISGTISAPNPLGMSSIINRVRLVGNAGIDIINLTGWHYHWLLRDHLEHFVDVAPSSTGRTAVTATSFDLSMWLPIALNGRDPLGLIMLQNEETLLTLEVEFNADANVATGATVAGTVVPMIEIFTVPTDPADYPPLNVLHQIVSDTVSIGAAGEYSYAWARGNTYIQVIHGCGLNTTPADNWSAFSLRVNQSENIERYTPALLDLAYARTHGRARVKGVIPIDFIGTSGLGNYGSTRDLLYSALVTELESVITASASGTLYTVRRQLVTLAG